MILKDKINVLSTKDLDLKGRRIINSAPSASDTDCVIRKEISESIIQEIALRAFNRIRVIYNIISFYGTVTFKNLVRFEKEVEFDNIKANSVSPVLDSAGITVTNEDGSVGVVSIDTVTPKVTVHSDIVAFNPGGISTYWVGDVTGGKFTKLAHVDSTNTGVLTVGNTPFNPLIVEASILYLNTTGNGDINLGSATSEIGFFGNTAAALQALSGYIPISTSSYTGITNLALGAQFAQVNDLNNLRLAVENMRAMVEDLRTKLLATGLIA